MWWYVFNPAETERLTLDPQMRDNQDQIREALTAVLDGTPIRQAARQFGVPKSTLFNRLKNPKLGVTLGNDVPVRRGREKYLQLDEEQVVVDWANNMTDVGLAPSAGQVLLALQLFLNRQGRQSGFKDNLPSEGWFRRFRARHNLEVRKTEPPSTPQNPPTEESIRQWFHQVSSYLNKDNLIDILADPTRIWSCMEAGFPLKLGSNELICPGNMDDYYYERKSSGRPTISLVSAVGANGGILHPFICYPYNRMPGAILETMPPGWNLANTDAGWMTPDIFLKYLKDHFIIGLQAMDIKFPILLLVDGHESHVSFEISEFCSDNGIILFGLHPRSIRILQPAYASIFRPLKEFWFRESQKWLSSHPTRMLTRQNFSPCLEPAWNSLTSETVRQAYAHCGIFPWNPERPDYSLCASADLDPGTPEAHPESPLIPDSPIDGEDSPKEVSAINNIPSSSASQTTGSSVTSVLTSALTSALKLAPKMSSKSSPKQTSPPNRRAAVPNSAGASPTRAGSLGHMTVGQLVISELETRIPPEQLQQFRQTKAKNVTWNGPIEWLRLYDMWKGLVDQYMVFPPSLPLATVQNSQRQRRSRTTPATPPHRPTKQARTVSGDNSFEWELPVYVELRESESADGMDKVAGVHSSPSM